MIQIDDAGWGSLVGGVLIGACRAESPQTQHAFREVPVQFFQGKAFEKKLYLDAAANAAADLMEELRVSKTEEVMLCTGHVLGAVRTRLTGEGYQVTLTKIGEPLQTLIEMELLNRVVALGVETSLEILTTKQGLYFWQCIRWLKGGDVDGTVIPVREGQCKTGWASYSTWAEHPYRIAKQKSAERKAERRRMQHEPRFRLFDY